MKARIELLKIGEDSTAASDLLNKVCWPSNPPTLQIVPSVFSITRLSLIGSLGCFLTGDAVELHTPETISLNLSPDGSLALCAPEQQ